MTGLLGPDWGTASLRADCFDGTGRVLDTRHRPWGIRQLPAGGFDAALAGISAGWPMLPRLTRGTGNDIAIAAWKIDAAPDGQPVPSR